LRKRLRRLKRWMRNENRWWRAGAIAALVLIAVAILVSGHRRHHHHRPPSGMAATAPMGPMPGLYGGILDPDLGMGPAGWGRQGHPHSRSRTGADAGLEELESFGPFATGAIRVTPRLVPFAVYVRNRRDENLEYV
jgi:hypothetical protein